MFWWTRVVCACGSYKKEKTYVILQLWGCLRELSHAIG